ncbi:MAG: putative membrane protein YphA (DoxX/SURF4 family) [Lentimonas sp.]|jgi:uncharacterized membrane protein YphA (DoxX/SURF4 family)
METSTLLQIICQFIVGLGILNVWLLRNQQATSYRGGASKTLQEEFAAYGLPKIVFYIVGVLKISAAIALLAGILLPRLVQPAATIMIILMIGAIVMHFKAKDSPIKFLPAGIVLVLSLVLVA